MSCFGPVTFQCFICKWICENRKNVSKGCKNGEEKHMKLQRIVVHNMSFASDSLIKNFLYLSFVSAKAVAKIDLRKA